MRTMKTSHFPFRIWACFSGLAIAGIMAITPAWAQSTSFNAGGAGGGSIIVGADTRGCGSALAGAMRYDASTNKIQICLPIPGCPNIGDACANGEVYVGTSPDTGLPMFMTTAAHQTTGPYGGSAQTGNPRCDAGSTAATCRTGAANTVALAALSTVQTVPRYCNNLVAHGYDDWYLPSRAEAVVLHQMHASIGSDMIDNEWYFTSSEAAGDYVWTVNSASGMSWHEGFKGNPLPARCVRNGERYNWVNWGG